MIVVSINLVLILHQQSERRINPGYTHSAGTCLAFSSIIYSVLQEVGCDEQQCLLSLNCHIYCGYYLSCYSLLFSSSLLVMYLLLKTFYTYTSLTILLIGGAFLHYYCFLYHAQAVWLTCIFLLLKKSFSSLW